MGTNDDMWFEPKRFGYGAGWPVAWQGWALLLGTPAAVALLGETLAERHWLAFTIATATVTATMLVLIARHTRGGWRWRWGGRDAA